jgi:hypothetical protein
LEVSSTARTAEERAFVRKVKVDVAAVNGEGLIPDVPSEWV